MQQKKGTQVRNRQITEQFHMGCYQQQQAFKLASIQRKTNKGNYEVSVYINDIGKNEKKITYLLGWHSIVRKTGCSCAADPRMNCSEFSENNLAKSVRKREQSMKHLKSNLKQKTNMYSDVCCSSLCVLKLLDTSKYLSRREWLYRWRHS